MSTTKFNFKVFFIFFCVWWVNLNIFKLLMCIKWIFWYFFSWVQLETSFIKEASGEFITVNYSEDSFIKIKVNTNIEIFPCYIVSMILMISYDFLSFYKDTLGYTTIFYFWFSYVNGVVIQVVVNVTISNSIIFISEFNN